MTMNALKMPHRFRAASTIRTIALATILALVATFAMTHGAQAVEEVNIKNGYAVHGYDVVAYFTQSKPTKGNDQFTLEYQGATYRFASADNRDRFAADPAKFAPQYGGFCAFGTSVGRKFDGDPNVWRIVDGKLYLNLNKKVQQRWLTDTPGFIRGADHNWPIIVSLPDAQLVSNPPEGLTQGAV